MATEFLRGRPRRTGPAVQPALAMLLATLCALPGPGLVAQTTETIEPQVDSVLSGPNRIRYWTMGRGDGLVLIHGLFGNGDVWRELAPLDEMARDWRIVAIDLRGHGGSSKPHDPSQYGRALASDVVAVLDDLGLRRAHVLGYSYGGLVVGALLASHPDRLTTAILGGASRVRPDTPQDTEWAFTLADRLEGDDGADWLVRALASGDPDQDARQKDLIERRMRDADLAAAAAVLRATGHLAVSDESLRRNEVPVLAIVGELDPSAREVLSMAQATAHMEVLTIPGADHASAPRTEIFWEYVRSWLGEHSPPEPP